jgi:hypothetical protein
MSDDALDHLRRQVALEDISEVLEATRGLARWSVVYSWANSDDPDECLAAIRLLVGEFDRLEAENAKLRAELDRRWYDADWTGRAGQNANN